MKKALRPKLVELRGDQIDGGGGQPIVQLGSEISCKIRVTAFKRFLEGEKGP